MKTFFYILIAITLPYLSNIYYYEKTKTELDQIKHEKIIVVYDDFKGTHGEIVSQLIVSEVNASDYKLLKFDTKDIIIPVMQKVLIDLASIEGRKVYLITLITPQIPWALL